MMIIIICLNFCYTILEMGMNRIKLRYQFTLTTSIFSLFFLAINYVGSKLNGNHPIYAYLLDWENVGTREWHAWNDLFFFITYWIVGTTATSLLVTLIHNHKSKCCKKPKEDDEAIRMKSVLSD